MHGEFRIRILDASSSASATKARERGSGFVECDTCIRCGAPEQVHAFGLLARHLEQQLTAGRERCVARVGRRKQT
jgi:hypothetical protein